MNITHIGIDLAKNIFSIHGVDERGHQGLVRDLRRRQMLPFFANLPTCTVGMEACGGAHYWARELSALGHRVRLLNPKFVRPYRKSDKNDHNDAEAICEALTRPHMRFVAVKSLDQQAMLTLHRSRSLLSTQRVALMNHIRGLLAEFGIVIAQTPAALRRTLSALIQASNNDLPLVARETFVELHDQLCD